MGGNHSVQEDIEVHNSIKGIKPITSVKYQAIREHILQQYPFLTSVFESTLITDASQTDCPIIFANDDFEKMTMYPREMIVGRNCRFLQGRHTNGRTVKQIRQAVDNGRRLEVEILNYRRDGIPFWNNFLMLPVCRRGKVRYFVAVQKNVSYLKKGNPVNEWSAPEVSMWLEDLGLPSLALKFLEKDVTGLDLLDLTEYRLFHLGVYMRKDIDLIMSSIACLKAERSQYSLSEVDRIVLHEQVEGRELKRESSLSEKLMKNETKDIREGKLKDKKTIRKKSKDLKRTPYAPSIDQDGLNFNPDTERPQQLEFWDLDDQSSTKAFKLYFGDKIEMVLLKKDEISLSTLHQRACKFFGLEKVKLLVKGEKNETSELTDHILSTHRQGGTVKLFVERDSADLMVFITMAACFSNPLLIVQGDLLHYVNPAFDREMYPSASALIGRRVTCLIPNWSSTEVGKGHVSLLFKMADKRKQIYNCSLSAILPDTIMLIVLQTKSTSMYLLDETIFKTGASGASKRWSSGSESSGSERDDSAVLSDVEEIPLSPISPVMQTYFPSRTSSPSSSLAPLPSNYTRVSFSISSRQTKSSSSTSPTTSSPLPSPLNSSPPTSPSQSPRSRTPSHCLATIAESDEGSESVSESECDNKFFARVVEEALFSASSGNTVALRFLASYRCIGSPISLVHHLQELYHHFQSKPLDTPINICLSNFLSIWVNNFIADFSSVEIRESVLALCKEVMETDVMNQIKLKMVQLKKPKPLPKVDRSLSIENEKFAQALTLHDWVMFSIIKPDEFADGNWQGPYKEKTAPNLTALAARSDNLSFWVAEKILCFKQLQKRVECIEKFVDIAFHLFKMNNFQTMMSIFLGMNLAPVARLRPTWDKVSQVHLNMYSEMERVMAPLNNYAWYRGTLAHRDQNAPCIPYIPILLRDLLYVYEHQKLNKKETTMELLQQVGSLILDIIGCQTKPYNFDVSEATLSYVTHISSMQNEEALFKLSLDLQSKRANVSIQCK